MSTEANVLVDKSMCRAYNANDQVERSETVDDMKSKVEVFLASLGDDADAVAASLRARGVRGRPRHNLYCPVAVALGREFPDWLFVVGTTTLNLCRRTGGEFLKGRGVQIPTPVSVLIIRMCSRVPEYADLIEPQEVTS